MSDRMDWYTGHRPRLTPRRILHIAIGQLVLWGVPQFLTYVIGAL